MAPAFFCGAMFYFYKCAQPHIASVIVNFWWSVQVNRNKDVLVKAVIARTTSKQCSRGICTRYFW